MSREVETEKGMVGMRRGKGCKNGVSLYKVLKTREAGPYIQAGRDTTIASAVLTRTPTYLSKHFLFNQNKVS